MKKLLKIAVGVVVVLVGAGWIWWDCLRLSPEQKANDKAAGAILQGDGQADDDLGDLGDELKSLGMDGGDEAEADKLLDELLAE